MLHKKFKIYIIAFASLMIFQIGCSQNAAQKNASSTPRGEIIYHVFERSFYDSNGDLNGDLNGLHEKLDYLQQLGVTSILMTPLYESVYYHNYFAINFKKIDPEYGAMQDYISLVKAIHQRGMKIYMDMETQYVTGDQLWYKDSYKNPKSPYSDYLIYNGPGNTKPEPIIFNLTELPGYDGTVRKVATVNLKNPKVKEFNYNLFKYWVDPNGDGKFDDGVDGFRLDHMMDDLDNKGILTNLFITFWNPLLTKLKQINPQLKNVAEQANWFDFGKDYFKKGGVDRVFAFRLMFAIRSFNKAQIIAAADTTFAITPDDKQQVVFIENHDTDRFSSAVHQDSGKLRIGAVLNLFIGGVPSIYYGQALGMTGVVGKFGMTDANDIPKREAFEWYKSDTGKGMALWYKNTGPWWDSTNLHPNDGISLEEEKNNPNSLWNFYKNIIHIRETNPALINGDYEDLKNNNDEVFSFLRYEKEKNKAIMVMVNLSDKTQNATIDFTTSPIKPLQKNLQFLLGNEKINISSNTASVTLPAYGIEVVELY